MTIELVTGVPGAGKTLYTLAKKCRPLIGTKVKLDDVLDPVTGQPVEVERRLKVCGVRDLLLEHDPIDFAPSHEPWDAMKREPGEPPLDVHQVIQNWWLWCMPGDVIVFDECQRAFRPAAAGQKIPAFIRELERHRHFGVDFIIITQHPQLIHVNVRNLVGRYEHVRRLLGRAATVVYEWDHCTNPDRTKDATPRLWRHDKSAFGLYKSAELHTKVKHKIPGAVVLAVAGFVALPVAAYNAFSRMHARTFGAAEVAAQAASAPASGASRSWSALPASGPTGAVAAVAPAGAASTVQGCIASKDKCRCIDSNGEWLTTDMQACKFNSENYGQWIKYPVLGRSAVNSFQSSPMSAPVVASAPEIRSDMREAAARQDVAPVLSAFADGHARR